MEAIALPDGVGVPVARGLMLVHRAEAERIVDASLAGGLSPTEALAKARRSIRDAQQARVHWLAEVQGEVALR